MYFHVVPNCWVGTFFHATHKYCATGWPYKAGTLQLPCTDRVWLLYRRLSYSMTIFGRLQWPANTKNNQLPYILEFFLWVLLILECAGMRIQLEGGNKRVLLIWERAGMRVQFEGGNKTRVGIINIATLPCLYVHCTPSKSSPYKHEICAWSW